MSHVTLLRDSSFTVPYVNTVLLYMQFPVVIFLEYSMFLRQLIHNYLKSGENMFFTLL